MTRLTKLALRNPSLTVLLMLLLLVGGIAASGQLNQELAPPVEFPQATVVTIWPGASAGEVTESIVEPIETALEDIEDVDVVEVSSSASDSFAAVTVRAEFGTVQDELKTAIEDEIDGLDLPDDAEDPEVLLFNFSDLPVIQASVRSKDDDLDPASLQRLIEDEVVPEIEAIEGVSQVTLAGGREEKVFLDLNPLALDLTGRSIGSIQGALGGNDLSFPAGTLELGGRALPLQVTHRIESLEDLEVLAIGTGGGGPPGGGGGPPGGGGAPAAAMDPAMAAELAALLASGDDEDAEDESSEADEDEDEEASDSADDEALVIDLPPEAAALGYETTEDLTPSVIRQLEAARPDLLRDIADEVIAEIPPGGPSPLSDEVADALPDDVREDLDARLDEEPEDEDASADADDDDGDRVRLVVAGVGDDLDDLARRYGVDASDIADENGLEEDENLRAGQVLRVPLADGASTALPSAWDAFDVDDAADVDASVMRRALREAPDAVATLTSDQLLALPDESLQLLPVSFLSRQPADLRDALLERLQADQPEAALPVNPNPSGGMLLRPTNQDPGSFTVRLSDLADVVREPEEASTLNRTDGVPSLSLIVLKEQSANTVSVVNEVLEELDRLEEDSEKEFDTELDFNVIFEQATFIEDSLNGVRNEGILGGIFAVIVILIFLAFSVRSTIVVAISIPLSILTALLLMRVQGLSLNLLTLAGLTIAIGRVVDDTIVVLENIYRHLQQGEPIGEAVINGVREVATAITSATLVAVAVFLPLGLVGGLTSQFFLPFALTTSYALLASLVVALTIVPLLARRLLRADLLPDPKETALQRLYTSSLEWALEHRLITLLAAGVFFLVSLGLLGTIDQTFLPNFGEPSVSVELAMPPGTDLATTDEIASEVETMLMDTDDIASVETTVGRGSEFFGEFAGGDSSKAFFFASLGEKEDDEDEDDEDNDGPFATWFAEEVDAVALAETIREDLEELAEDLERDGLIDNIEDLSFTVSGGAAGGPQGNAFDLQIQSESEDSLRAANAMVLEALEDDSKWEDEGYDESPLLNLKSNLTEAREVLQVDVDPVLADQRGLSTIQVGIALREVLEGVEVGDIELVEDGESETLDVVARFPEDTIASIEDLADYAVSGDAGPVPIGDVATLSQGPGPVEITRIDGERAALLTAEITLQDTFGVQDTANKIIEDLDLEDEFDKEGEEVVVGAGAESSQQREGFRDMLIALPISIIIVYLIMVLTFGSLVHPFTILFSLPFAVSGALFGLALTNRALGMSSLIGMMMLIGIVTTNAIVLVDLVQQYRERGMDARTALIKGGRNRLRPILMTALATIFALVPQAIGLTEGALIASELATTVIGGLLVSTLLTLIIVPVIYSLLDVLTGSGSEAESGLPDLPPDGDLDPEPAAVSVSAEA